MAVWLRFLRAAFVPFEKLCASETLGEAWPGKMRSMT